MARKARASRRPTAQDAGSPERNFTPPTHASPHPSPHPPLHENGHAPIPLWRRLDLWRAGLRSSMRRYSRDVFYREGKGARAAAAARVALERDLSVAQHAWAVFAGSPGGEAPATFAQAWNSIPARENGAAAALAWLGHCSVLLKVGGLTVLTDPVLSPKIGVRLGPVMVGPRRLAPALPIEDLPRADLILISHAHFDHLDKPTLRRLADQRTLVITAARTGPIIPRGFAGVRELEWGEHLSLPGEAGNGGGLRIEAVRPRHWGARTAWDRHRGYNSYVLRPLPGATGAGEGEASRGGSAAVLFAGDTAYTEEYARVAPIDLAIMGIGAYDPWEHAHATPEQAYAMARHARARRLLPVHHSTFALSDEPLHEPLERLHRAAGPRGAVESGGEQGPEVVHAPIGRIVVL